MIKQLMTIKLIIDGKEVEVPEGTTILEAAESIGIEIPTLCHLKELRPFGACRICVVEVEGAKSLAASCSCPVSNMMEVRTNTERVIKARRLVIDLLLSAHPADCLTCEKNGACLLQKYAYEYDVRTASFTGEKHDYPIDVSNPFIEKDLNKCILCGKCIRICEEVQGITAIDFAGRGFNTTVSTFLNSPLTETDCVFCGQCVAVCPVGALTEKIRRFRGREWEFKKVSTICPYCGVGCQFDLNVKNEEIVKVTSHEGSIVNGINLCVKGRFGFDFIDRKDRLKTPLVKKNGKFQETDWNTALDLIANKFKGIKRKNGADSIALLSSAKCTGEENYLMQKFARAVIGTNNVDHCARLCHASTVAGLAKAFGSGAMTNSISEIRDTDCIFVIGSNTTETHPVIALEIKRAVMEGAKLIVADPRCIELSSIAQIYLQHRPGTDVALLNSMMNVIFKNGLWDETFVNGRCENFENFRKVIEKYPPEKTEQITGIKSSDLIRAAKIYAKSKKAIIFFSMGITQHITGTDNVLSIANLAMLTGHVGKENCGVNPLRGQNNVQGACDLGALPNVLPGYQSVSDKSLRQKFSEQWKCKIPSKPGLTLVEMVNEALAGEIRAMYIMGENPMVSDPDINHVKKALEKLDFLVVQDIFLTETAELADVVLPAASFAEKDGTFTNTERRIQRVRKAIKPPGDSKPDWEIICLLSQKMGYEMNYSSPAEIMDEIAAVTPIYGGISYSRIDENGLQWPCRSADDPGTKYLHKGDFSRGKGLFTPVEFKPPAEMPDSEYPFILTTGRMYYHFHTRSMTKRSKGLDETCPEGYAEISLKDAEKLKIAVGEEVQIKSRRGKIRVKAMITERVPQGLVFIPFHFAEAAANLLTNPALDPVAKIPELKVAACRISKLQK